MVVRPGPDRYLGTVVQFHHISSRNQQALSHRHRLLCQPPHNHHDLRGEDAEFIGPGSDPAPARETHVSAVRGEDAEFIGPGSDPAPARETHVSAEQRQEPLLLFFCSKIEDAFYDHKLRLNGQKLVKKSKTVKVGDTLDLIVEEDKEKDVVTLKRVVLKKIVGETNDGEKLKVLLRSWKHLQLPKQDAFRE
ncbi:hypothetical protein PDJAM_G00191570 [Pangasius djambal]|uniref:Uncharacterized protein n=1 Tax=Pangasius djambal TaxID=1691987 RepID=A0ACC5Y621_9TELE|nr:hypothetical protein [Pangasius djambal]